MVKAQIRYKRRSRINAETNYKSDPYVNLDSVTRICIRTETTPDIKVIEDIRVLKIMCI